MVSREHVGDEPAPIKLYLPIVSVVAADSKRNERLDLDLISLGSIDL